MATTPAGASGAAPAPDDNLGGGLGPGAAGSGDSPPAVGAATVEQDGYDPFAAYPDETPNVGGAAREPFLSARGFTTVRHVFVQHIPGSPQRPSTLGALVTARQPRALLLYLLVLACEHRLRDNRKLSALTWARMLSTAHFRCTTAQFRKAVSVLETMGLLHVRWSGTMVELVPCTENGDGQVRDEPTGNDEHEDEDLRRYFALPNEFFSDEILDQLTLPGIAMLLVALKETTKTAVFSISVERFSAWYGWSERTAERGYRELAAAGLTDTHKQTVKDQRAPRGISTKYHRLLLGAFNTQARIDLRRTAQNAAAAKAAKDKATRAAAVQPKTSTKETVAATPGASS